MTRFRSEDLVELGGGWVRHAEPGEELYRLCGEHGPIGRWMPEDIFLRYCTDAELPWTGVETLVVPAVAEATAPEDERQLGLLFPAPLEAA